MVFEKSCRKEKQISKQKKIQTFSRKNKYSCIIYNTRKKKKQATDKPYCLLHNNVIRKFPCFFHFSLPQNHLLVPHRRQLAQLSCRIVFLIRVSKVHNSSATSFFLLNELLLKRAAGSWQEGETDRK